MGDTSPKKDQIGGSGEMYMPSPKRIEDGGTDAVGLVVPRMPARASGVPIQYPMLSDSNYGP